MRPEPSFRLLPLVAALAAALVALAQVPPAAAAERPTIRIGSKNFTEQLVLGEMYALLLEKAGFQVERKLNLGGTLLAHEALKAGEIDLYPEYTGTALLNMLKKDVMSDPSQVYEVVKAEYRRRWDLVWLDPAPMNNTQAIAITRKTAEKYNMYTLSAMSKQAPNLVLAAVPEFTERPDGLKGLKRVYGGFDFKSVRLVDYGIKYRALVSGQADVTVAFGTDGEIKGYDLVIVKDDKGLWPPYQVAPVVRQALLDKAPDVATVLNRIQPKLTDAVMQELNWQVDGKKREYAEVAREYLTQQGLL
ncbi:MAG TPA: glycine betaine ABC transporter substrate-binding protein [Thermodesulfobacteriota bacterium]